jgi:5'-3' exonuclease
VQLVITEDSDLLAYGCPRCVYLGRGASKARLKSQGSSLCWQSKCSVLSQMLLVTERVLSRRAVTFSLMHARHCCLLLPLCIFAPQLCACLCRVLYKLDKTGACEEVSLTDLPNCPTLPLSGWTSDQFLQLCVMAGCDFLTQLPGIGLKKAHGVLRKYRSFTKVCAHGFRSTIPCRAVGMPRPAPCINPVLA